MYQRQQKRLVERLRVVLQEKYDVAMATIPIEQPPEIRLGEYALPIAFELAKRLRKAPRKIAEELVVELAAAFPPSSGFAGFEAAGAGYINVRLDRGTAVRALSASGEITPSAAPVHALVEHTSINPNKAAHVGHLRNAILGDTFVRMLRAAGNQVSVQNYIDNTGVQVADIVVGLQHLEGMHLAEVDALIASAHAPPIDYICWDLYARTSQWYTGGTEQENAARKQLRLDTLHQIEAGNNETAAVAERISTAVLRRHLQTMQRLDIEYDLLPRESEILHLDFWDAAFTQLKATGVLYYESAGKNTGCWVMRRAGQESAGRAGEAIGQEGAAVGSRSASEGPDEEAKVIVRSNGTVTYVGKDIAYHLWKFGLLGKDFGYLPFFRYPGHECWITAVSGSADHPHFGGAQAIYNVIDSRQSDPQSNVVEALRGMGYSDQAARYTHFSYEMVALTPRCALELGYDVSDEDRARPFIEVSGRKGFGVKADDLIDKLIAATRAEVTTRNPELPGLEQDATAKLIAVGALRYFMLKFTRNTVIAFDFADALSFEGETGPYLQYAVVRTRSIFRKAGTTPEEALGAAATLDLSAYVDGKEGDSIWEVWLRAAKTSLILEQAIQQAEPAYLARHAFLLAQEFSAFYRKHHILTEADPSRKALLLATAAITQGELVRTLGLLGIVAPEVM